MQVIVVGLGVQGRKRQAVAGRDVVATVDPVRADADFADAKDVPLDRYDGVLLCVPDGEKQLLIEFFVAHGKHVLVEKPLPGDRDAIDRLERLARAKRTVCYTAYNHRFEPHFVRMRDALASGTLGRPYLARLFYGNGTARDVRESLWRDRDAGVLPDLGSHLIDTMLFWFGDLQAPFELRAAHRFENRAFDHVSFSSEGPPAISIDVALVSWRNHFTADVYCERGSAHIESLCKWGPSSFTMRDRKLPSGRPNEEIVTLVQPDPTWVLEYEHFTRLCAEGVQTDLGADRRIADGIASLSSAALVKEVS
jgi:predicted dehydrogenase